MVSLPNCLPTYPRWPAVNGFQQPRRCSGVPLAIQGGLTHTRVFAGKRCLPCSKLDSNTNTGPDRRVSQRRQRRTALTRLFSLPPWLAPQDLLLRPQPSKICQKNKTGRLGTSPHPPDPRFTMPTLLRLRLKTGIAWVPTRRAWWWAQLVTSTAVTKLQQPADRRLSCFFDCKI